MAISPLRVQKAITVNGAQRCWVMLNGENNKKKIIENRSWKIPNGWYDYCRWMSCPRLLCVSKPFPTPSSLLSYPNPPPCTLVQYSRPSCSHLIVGMHFTRHKRGKPSKNRSVFNSKWHENFRVTWACVVVLVVVRSVLTCHMMLSEYCSHQTQRYLHCLIDFNPHPNLHSSLIFGSGWRQTSLRKQNCRMDVSLDWYT